ncbi:MAG: lysine-2,3-aminomutase-like protein [Telmatospirillum sp.]|nr:lysine-2,3-aminomutase-like protein [Telmatospirillum sp.]
MTESPVPPARPGRRRTLRNAADIEAAGLAAGDRIADIAAVASRYAVAITPTIADLIDPADPADPVARQFVPDARELVAATGERTDPIGDDVHSPLPGIVHRYPDRVLLTPILHCPVYCRFCFRREKVGGDEAMLSPDRMAAAIAYIRDHEDVWEVVITGGDPLMLPAARLAALLQELDAIDHVKVVRLHSRIPVSDPDRVDAAMLAALDIETALFVAIHCNHPRELAPAAATAIRRLTKAGIPLLSQTVLLKGVNDTPAVMEELMRALVALRIKPYYLHHPDLAPGTGHFRSGIARGQALMRHLRGRVSGLCQPHYVLDIPGGHGKAPIGPVYLENGHVIDWQGNRHHYPPDD